MKKNFCAFLLTFLLFDFSFAEDKDVFTIDSVRISVSGKELLNTVLHKEYKDSVFIYQSGDTTVQMLSKLRVLVKVNGVKTEGQTSGKNRKEYTSVEFRGDNGIRVFIKTMKPDPGFFPKTNSLLAYVFPLFTIFAVVVSAFSWLRNRNKKRMAPGRKDGAEIIKRLEQLDYFNFTPKKLKKELQTEMISGLNEYGQLCTIDDENLLEPCDLRFYFLDGEALYEEEGIIEALDRVKNAFNKRGLVLDWKEEQYEFTEKTSYYSIVLNEKVYAIQYKEYAANSWGLAVKFFLSMLNDQLLLQQSGERAYPIADEEQFVFLTREQFDYISSLGLQERNRPVELEYWIKSNDL